MSSLLNMQPRMLAVQLHHLLDGNPGGGVRLVKLKYVKTLSSSHPAPERDRRLSPPQYIRLYKVRHARGLSIVQ